MFLEGALLAWSALALLWWVISLGLVWVEKSRTPPAKPAGPLRSLTIFKPLAPLGAREFDPRGVESFLPQLAETDELLLGMHEADRPRLEPVLARWRAQFPRARLQVVWRGDEPDAMPNPKVAWLKILAAHAGGELWLWSDADIGAPPDFLRQARGEYAAGGARLLTWPYIVRETATPPAVLDALYVNAEFFPGVLLLRRRGPVDFALGAAMLFARADFDAEVDWADLGSRLADDFLLGQKLRPVRIGRATLATTAEADTWPDAVRHYLRWNKTVRWSRPGGTAARIVVLPVLGWIAFALFQPGSVFGWAGLAGMMQADVIAAALLCAGAGCRLRLRDLPVLELWSLGRAMTWLACWLPWPVVWNGRTWWRPVDKT